MCPLLKTKIGWQHGKLMYRNYEFFTNPVFSAILLSSPVLINSLCKPI